jgi:hypothetical protein
LKALFSIVNGKLYQKTIERYMSSNPINLSS